ncbi:MULTISPECIES: alpha/beta hydrolase [unclassified Mesorhizobium]|uniref:alpha/beta hydrolase n=1 Tax=unclassified Mesorhizobium TaxID=325217 RepID=UPI0006FA4F42|nr:MULTISPECIES: alpha/beta hydrolase [unclassified Mesorhizobium]KQZ15682.1 alpha/beta hydrolase [Mesorhizobium sp. Root1471]KQZ38190.1 alpha/beta hydrolase [Mesorhizobium sp. Root554]MDR7033076.1 pimeloyl-ACP methyl ester carboxylesterase [Mesorhizobium sp. BE184]
MAKAERTPVMFVHGLWLHSSSWEGWAERFREAGYEPILPEWPGVPNSVAEARKHPDQQAGVGLMEISTHHADIIRKLPSKPILIGHSVGGFIVQHLLGQDLGRAAIAICPGQIKGVFAIAPAQARSTIAFLSNPANTKRAVSLNPAQFRFGFANAVSQQECDEMYSKWTIPSPARPLFQLALGNFIPNSPAKVDTANAKRGPLLLMSGKLDHTVPDVLTRSTFKQYRNSSASTEYKRYDDRGHSLICDSGWPQLAEDSLAWLKAKGLGA